MSQDRKTQGVSCVPSPWNKGRRGQIRGGGQCWRQDLNLGTPARTDLESVAVGQSWLRQPALWTSRGYLGLEVPQSGSASETLPSGEPHAPSFGLAKGVRDGVYTWTYVHFHMARPRRRISFRGPLGQRGVSPIIGTVLMVAITVVLAAVLYAVVQIPLSPPPPVVGVQSYYNDTSVVIYGEDNGPGSNQCPKPSYTCTMLGNEYVVTQVQGVVPISQVVVLFYCDGGLAQIDTLSDILVSSLDSGNAPPPGGTPSSSNVCPDQAGVSTGAIAPQGAPPPPPPPPPPPGGGTSGCVNHPAWAGATLSHLVYFVPSQPGEQVIHAGDVFVAYGSACHVMVDSTPGDDYYGPPLECQQVPGLCFIELLDGNNIIDVLQFAQGAP